MALYGILGDIHGNREALEAVFDALDRRGAQRVVCLGDIVGYNADPDECVELVRSRCTAAIAGNHDLIGIGRLDFGRCSIKAEYSLRQTRRTLSSASISYLEALPANAVLEDGVVLVHGGVRDVQQYMPGSAQIVENAAYLRADFPGAWLCFFGHSHEQRVYRVSGDTVSGCSVHELDGERHALEKQNLYFVNPGSVDASRKRGPRLAECALFNTLERTIEFLRVPYDSAAAEAKAAVFGYRINALTDQLYTLRRRTASAARRIGARLQRGAHSGR
jgi:predicted phosphodiesterase